jgi:hypothetical protein
MNNKNIILTIQIFFKKLNKFFIKSVANFFYIIYVYIQVLVRCFEIFLTLCLHIVTNLFFILLDCCEDLHLFFVFLINEFIYPLYLRRKENRQAKLDYRAHRDFMYKEKRDREIAMQSPFERFCHKAIDLFLKFSLSCWLFFSLIIWYCVWDYEHNDKPIVEKKLSLEEIEKLNVSPEPLYHPPIDTNYKPPVKLPDDENLIETLTRLARKAFIVNYEEENNVIIIRPEEYLNYPLYKNTELERLRRMPKTNPFKEKTTPSNEKVSLDDDSFLDFFLDSFFDISTLYLFLFSPFLFPPILLAKYIYNYIDISFIDISFIDIFYFNLDFLFRSVLYFIS